MGSYQIPMGNSRDDNQSSVASDWPGAGDYSILGIVYVIRMSFPSSCRRRGTLSITPTGVRYLSILWNQYSIIWIEIRSGEADSRYNATRLRRSEFTAQILRYPALPCIRRVPTLRHCDAFLTNFTATKFPALNCSERLANV
ncbi:hypothetical protein EVAR_8933_1 [Eumeta japonica]|uniref:Uncharacterized protein n=1 Tax=Eumeta variegata TaxID=151549 RepID=A0A4C1U0A8_EUMVA|nr:hypothetical protein EVAR_8933_1 [Eumeta japonica]